MNIDMAIFHQAFFEEATDLIADFERELLVLEDTLDKDIDLDDPELLNTIFRCAHSLKGGAATFGFSDIAGFTHGLETLLDRVRNHQVAITRNLTQVLFEALDQLKALLAAARGEIDAAPDSTALTAKIEAAANNANAPAAEEEKNEAQPEEDWWGVWNRPTMYRLYFKPGADVLSKGGDPALLMTRLTEAVEMRSISCDPAGIPSLDQLNPEECYLAWTAEFVTDWDRERIMEIFEFMADDSEIVLEQLTPDGPEAEAPRKSAGEPVAETSAVPVSAGGSGSPAPREGKAAAAPARAAAGSSGSADTQTLRVSTDKIDKLINLVGELVINQAMLNDVAQNFSMDKMARLMEAVAQMEHASRELQERVMAVRMLPIKHAFGRFPRLVRDTAAVVGKQIELRMSGEETELDKTVIEAIADPLTHLVRNSIDHGLESPEGRVEAGKPVTGVVSLDAFQEGGSIVVNVSDDGRGLNRNKIFNKAVERGLIGEDEVLSDEQIYELIFEPGFSTADQVTDLSGRGVGMDIVKRTINGLGGTVNVTSNPGTGTTFRIRLPLTMAILEGLSVSVGEEVYILPLTSIVENIRPRSGDVSVVAGGSEVVHVRGEVLPLVRLYRVFNAIPREVRPDEALLVIVENESRKVAIMVDELITQSQIVIKSIETNYRKVDGIAGATIMGDGRVALILDVPSLVRGARTRSTEIVAA
jgi:two-component system chemotaxis sensor kinase CheA